VWTEGNRSSWVYAGTFQQVLFQRQSFVDHFYGIFACVWRTQERWAVNKGFWLFASMNQVFTDMGCPLAPLRSQQLLIRPQETEAGVQNHLTSLIVRLDLFLNS
jgi:hypothetical protein